MTEIDKLSEKAVALQTQHSDVPPASPNPAEASHGDVPRDSFYTHKPVVLLVNLGTPDTPTSHDVRSFLREFLSDRRVIETHPLIWRPILEGIILRIRPRQSAEKYRTVWLDEGSPLMHWTRRQAELMQEELGESVEVRYAMRYGQPAIRTVLDEVYRGGARRILVLPAYPQYAASSAGTVIDEVARHLLASRDQLEIRTVRSFPEAPDYIEALAHAIESSWEERGKPDFEAGDRLILSFHSIPRAMHDAGDPYRQECEATAAALRARLGLEGEALTVTYQSVFGPAEWIAPATIDTVERLGREGVGRLDVICPGFMADCLETLEEIDQLNRETFIEAGGREFHYIPWGNDSRGVVRALVEQVRQGVAGW